MGSLNIRFGIVLMVAFVGLSALTSLTPTALGACGVELGGTCGPGGDCIVNAQSVCDEDSSCAVNALLAYCAPGASCMINVMATCDEDANCPVNVTGSCTVLNNRWPNNQLT